MLYLHETAPRLALKLFRENQLSPGSIGISPLPTPHHHPFNGCVFGPPMPFTASSSWTWVGHPVSGLPELTLCPVKTRFPFGSVPSVLNLASPGNSPDRSTKSTRSHFVVLPQLVNTGFQVLFHSPPGVLFTFLHSTMRYRSLRSI